jgi:hypothetical protein
MFEKLYFKNQIKAKARAETKGMDDKIMMLL